MRTRCFIALTLLFIELSAWAQPGPIYFIEHDWTLRVGKARFGLFQDKLLGDEKCGAGRHTTLYFGNASFTLKTRSFQKYSGAVALAAITGCAFCFAMYKARNTETNVTEASKDNRSPGQFIGSK